jgi:hypothetical protein
MRDREEIIKAYEEDITYLQRNIPPDDIYQFAQQLLVGSLFFLEKWSDWVTIDEEMEKCPETDKWVRNIVNFYVRQQNKEDQTIELGIKETLDE